ncbi:MAG: methyl-coenzyme reductase beta subunit, partial [Euryarchaeota archaeon]|nr:methyl-coenzyme reductase beta subunit [Euryarchaeota archaeon]
MSDTVDIYDDRGKLLESNVDIMNLAPTRNAAIKKIILDTKRSVAVSLAGIQGALASGKMGGKGRQILGRGLNYDIVGNVDALAADVKKLVQVDEGDDTVVKVLKGGKSLLIQSPSSRMAAGADYMAATTVGAAAVTQAILDKFNTDMYDAPIVKGAVWGSYPQTMDLMGGQVQGILSIPQNNEGLGYSLRNIMANHVAAITNRGAMNAAALSSIYEQAGIFEMGGAVGMFERHQLLGLACQGLNANNVVYNTVKENGKDGTIGTVIQSIVARAIEDGVISVDKTAPSGYKFYKANDVPMLNAFAAVGTLAATMVNCGAARAAQGVSA